MPAPKKRTPKTKRTTYTLRMNPSTTRQLTIRGRKKPRKARVTLINQFNKLVEKGIVSDINFDKQGNAKAKLSRKLTPEEAEIFTEGIWLIQGITQEPFFREQSPASKEDIAIKRTDSALKEHGRQGQFTFIHPKTELRVMEGKNAELKAKVQSNLRKQLRYFESILKAKKKKEMAVSTVKNQEGEETIRIKLDRNKVIRETIVKINSFNVGIVSKVILEPNGKVMFETFETTINK